MHSQAEGARATGQMVTLPGNSQPTYECRVLPADVSNAMLPRYLLGLLINILAGICLLWAYLTHERVVNTDGAENTAPPGSLMCHCARRGSLQTAMQRRH